jgi:hypothetical protein
VGCRGAVGRHDHGAGSERGDGVFTHGLEE